MPAFSSRDRQKQASKHVTSSSIHGGSVYHMDKQIKASATGTEQAGNFSTQIDPSSEDSVERPVTVHDGSFFAAHVFSGKPATPQERVLVEAAAWSNKATEEKRRNASKARSASGSSAVASSAIHAVRSWWLLTGVHVSLRTASLVRRPKRQAKSDLASDPTLIQVLPTSVCKAVGLGKITVARAWLAVGGDVNARDSNERTLLMVAAAESRHAIVTELLSRGAAPDLKQSQGCTALLLACMTSNESVIQALLDAGADVNAKSRLELTPLIMACRTGHSSIVRLLLNAGARADQADSAGSSAAMHAMHAGSAAALMVLRQHAKTGATNCRFARSSPTHDAHSGATADKSGNVEMMQDCHASESEHVITATDLEAARAAAAIKADAMAKELLADEAASASAGVSNKQRRKHASGADETQHAPRRVGSRRRR